MREIPDEPDFAAEMEMQGIPAESDFATELEWRCARHPLLMIAWVGVDYLVNELLMTQAAIEDKVKRSITRNGLCHMIQVQVQVHASIPGPDLQRNLNNNIPRLRKNCPPRFGGGAVPLLSGLVSRFRPG